MYFNFPLVIFALILDYFFADPKKLPHPVIFLGHVANFLELNLRNLVNKFCSQDHYRLFLKLAGLVGVIALVAFSVGFVFAVINFAEYFFGNKVAFLAELYFAWSGLAFGSLLNEGRLCLNTLEKLEYLEKNSPDYMIALEQARFSISMLVSRDTSNMEAKDLMRSLAESLSENFCDAFVAPLFWLLVGGPAGLWGYKAVSTLDSMWGYKTEKWRDFGFIAAKLDDALAYIPSRLSALIFYFTALLYKQYPNLSLKKVAVDAKKMESPNAGWSMSSVAWILNAQMGGLTPYTGKLVEKPILGDKEFSAWTCLKLHTLLSLLKQSFFLVFIVILFMYCLSLVF